MVGYFLMDGDARSQGISNHAIALFLLFLLKYSPVSAPECLLL